MERQRLTEFNSDTGHSFRLLEHAELTRAPTRRRLIKEARETLQALTSGNCKEDQKHAEMALFRGTHACAREIMNREKRGKASAADRAETLALINLHRDITDFLFNANLGLVYDMRRRLGPVDLDEQEMRSAGMWSLYQAIVAFDPWRGFRFSTYACNAITRGYGHVWKQKRARRRRLLEYADRNQRDIDPVIVPEDDSAVAILRDRLVQALEHNTGHLSATERLIIERRFLVREGEKGDTLASVGKLVRLSKERVRQIQIEALGKLRTALGDDPVVKSLVGEV